MKLGKTINVIIDGCFIGIGIGFSIAVGISSFCGGFQPGPLELISKVGSLRAAQMLLFYSALIGFSFGISGKLIWEKENWSLLISTVMYFAINLAVMLLAGIRMCWFSITLESIAIFIAIYVVIFFIIWGIFYRINKKEAQRLNEKINSMK